MDETPISDVFEIKELGVNITLPDNSPVKSEDLKVSSLISFENNVSESGSKVALIDDDAMELAVATNSNGNIVLMNFANPTETEALELNSTTTAVSLAMLHPWVMHLSAEARKEAYQAILQLPEFPVYHDRIVDGINSGEIDPLASEDIIEATTEFLGVVVESIQIESGPLSLEAENGLATVTNNSSTLAYSLQLYDAAGQSVGEEHLLAGVDREFVSWHSFKTVLAGDFRFSQPTVEQVPIPDIDQVYTLKANSWEGKAAWSNGAGIFANIVGIVSPGLKKLVNKFDCAITVGSRFSTLTNELIQNLPDKEAPALEVAKQLILLTVQHIQSIYELMNDCGAPGDDERLKLLMKRLGILGLVVSSEQALYNINDLVAYDSEIEFCMLKTGSEITKCHSNDLIDDLFAIKTLREVNGLDISDPRWNTADTTIAREFLRRQAEIEMKNGRVTELNYSSKELMVIPPEIGRLAMLNKLILRANELSSLPDEVWNLHQLGELDVFNNNLSVLSDGIGNLSNLQRLVIRGNALTSLPDGIGNLSKLTELTLSNNRLTSVPSSIGGMTNLIVLRVLNNSDLKCLPQEVWHLNTTGTGIFWAGTGISEAGDIDCID